MRMALLLLRIILGARNKTEVKPNARKSDLVGFNRLTGQKPTLIEGLSIYAHASAWRFLNYFLKPNARTVLQPDLDPWSKSGTYTVLYFVSKVKKQH